MQNARLFAAWWCGLVLLYVVLVSTVALREVALGVVLAAPVAVLAVAATRAFGEDLRPPGFVWRELLRLPGTVARDSVALVGHLLLPRTTPGRTRVETLTQVTPGRRRAVRAHEVLLRSASPGSVVVEVDVDDDPDRIRVHRLPGRSR